MSEVGEVDEGEGMRPVKAVVDEEKEGKEEEREEKVARVVRHASASSLTSPLLEHPIIVTPSSPPPSFLRQPSPPVLLSTKEHPPSVSGPLFDSSHPSSAPRPSSPPASPAPVSPSLFPLSPSPPPCSPSSTASSSSPKSLRLRPSHQRAATSDGLTRTALAGGGAAITASPMVREGEAGDGSNPPTLPSTHLTLPPHPQLEEPRPSITHSRSSRIIAHMEELKREKEQRLAPLTPTSPDPARQGSHSRGNAGEGGEEGDVEPPPLTSPISPRHHLSLLPLDTDDLPFHMLDPDTMTLGLDLRFIDYPDLERKYQTHQQSKIFQWVSVRLSLLLLVFLIVSAVDLITRLTSTPNPSSPTLVGTDALDRFITRAVGGLLPGAVLVFILSKSRSAKVGCLTRPFVRVFPYLSHVVLLVLCVLSSNLFLTDVDLPYPNIDTWCSVIVLCGLASSLFRLPSIHNLIFVTWSTLCYLVSFVILPLVTPSSLVDGSSFSLGLVTQCLLFCVCMFICFYVNSRVMEVRTRERYLTLLAIKKQRKDTGALLERLLPKTIIGRLLEMGRLGREEEGTTGGSGGAWPAIPERALAGSEGAPGWEEGGDGRKERQMSDVSQVSERRASIAFPFGVTAKSASSPRPARHDRHRTMSATNATSHAAAPAAAARTANHQRDRSSLPSMVPPPGAPPSLLANIYPSVTVMQADVCSFTPLCARSTPQQIITLLNSLFLMFDSLTDRWNVYKVETIGDAVLAVCGAPTPDMHHAWRMCELALEARDELKAFTPAHDQTPVRMRFGLHSGRVVGGVVGLKKMPRFHIYGQTVSDAGVMEQRAEPMTICMSGATWRSVRTHDEDRVAEYEVKRLWTKGEKDGSLSQSETVVSDGDGSGGEGGSGSWDDADSDGEGEDIVRRYELVRKRRATDTARV